VASSPVMAGVNKSAPDLSPVVDLCARSSCRGRRDGGGVLSGFCSPAPPSWQYVLRRCCGAFLGAGSGRRRRQRTRGRRDLHWMVCFMAGRSGSTPRRCRWCDPVLELDGWLGARPRPTCPSGEGVVSDDRL
jgi:hypothetical protein